MKLGYLQELGMMDKINQSERKISFRDALKRIIYTAHGHKLNFSHLRKVGKKKDFAHPT